MSIYNFENVTQELQVSRLGNLILIKKQILDFSNQHRVMKEQLKFLCKFLASQCKKCPEKKCSICTYSIFDYSHDIEYFKVCEKCYNRCNDIIVYENGLYLLKKSIIDNRYVMAAKIHDKNHFISPLKYLFESRVPFEKYWYPNLLIDLKNEIEGYEALCEPDLGDCIFCNKSSEIYACENCVILSKNFYIKEHTKYLLFSNTLYYDILDIFSYIIKLYLIE